MIESITDIIKIIVNGLKTFFDFILELPNLIHNLLVVFPEPFYTIVSSFIGFIIVIIFLYVLTKVLGFLTEMIMGIVSRFLGGMQ